MREKSTTLRDRIPPPASLYVNHFGLAHNQYEFVIELGQYRPDGDTGDGTLGVHTCLALAPPYAKMLSDLLVRAVKQHEREHGVIAPVSAGAPPFDLMFHALPEVEARARALRENAMPDGDAAAVKRPPQRRNQDRSNNDR